MLLAVFVLLALFRTVTVLYSLLTRAAGHWAQYRVSMIESKSAKPMSTTSVTELYYLRHNWSCAATAMGNKGGNSSPGSSLQISGADFIGRLVLTVFLSVARLAQTISQMALYYGKIAMKLIILVLAMLRVMFNIVEEVAVTCLTPLELEACLHLCYAYMHRDRCMYYCESNYCLSLIHI